MRRPVVAWVGLGTAIALVLAGGVLTLAGNGDVTEVAAGLVLVLPFAGVGALIAARQPDNLIGWLLVGIGVGLSVTGISDGATEYGLERHYSAASNAWLAAAERAHDLGTGSPGVWGTAGWTSGPLPPALGFFALVSSFAFLGFFILFFLVLLLLPNGRLLTPRWRVVVWGIALLAIVEVTLVVRPGPMDDWVKEGIRNPLGVQALEPVTSVLYQVEIALSFACLISSIASVVLRFRRSTGVERAQLRWIAAAVAATGVTWVTMAIGGLILGDRPAADILWVLAILSITFIPIGIGIAVLRYRLYEIDRVISRTLVYAALTLVLGASYVGLVLAGQALFSSFAGGSNLAIAASTLVVAALFLPVRSRVQRFVDRRFYRRRYDAQRTLEGFGARLREQIDLGTLEHDLRGVVTETMQPAHASVWLRTGARS